MNVDNKITISRITKSLDLRTVLIVVLVVAVAMGVLYVTLQNRDKKEILIWYVTEDSGTIFADGVAEKVNAHARENGFNRALMTRRDPADQYFDALMSTSAFYTCDIFIMQAEVAQKYVEMDIFMTIDDAAMGSQLFNANGNPIGILICENYYLLINSKTELDMQMIYDIYDILTKA